MSQILELPRPGRHGARPVLIALHSSGSSPRQWDAWRAHWPAGLDVLTPGLLGAETVAEGSAKPDGGSAESRPENPPDWPLGRGVSLDEEAQRLAPLLARDAGGVHLFGHSYGGAVALQMALRWPERVRSLTLYEPVRFALLRNAADAVVHDDIIGAGRRIGMQALSRNADAAAEIFIDYWAGAGSWQQMPLARRGAVAARMPKVQAEFEALFADRVPAGAYAALPMPVLLLGGTRSPLPARRVLQRLAALCPQAETVTLTGLGHLGPIQDPARVAAAVLHSAAWAPAARARAMAA